MSSSSTELAPAPRMTPARALYVLSAFAALGVLLLVELALRPPWLGVRLATSEDGARVIVQASRHAALPAGAVLVAVSGAGGERVELRSVDVIEEPDLLHTYEEMSEFFARQGRLYRILQGGEVTLHWERDGQRAQTSLRPGARPLADLPFVFWFQVAVGVACFLIPAWVFLVRPDDWGARMFALTGLAFPFSACSAALYSVRELALPEDVFRLLSAANHFGATAFGMALVSLFAVYPRLLVPPRYLFALPAVFLPWFALDVTQRAPDLDWGVRIPLLLELALAIGFAVAQWRRSRRQPLARASLRWFALATLIGCSLFILAVPAHSVLGLPLPLSQGYAFGFFLIMYVGIALGLRRYRLFDIDAWSYRVLLWVGGAATVILLDVALVLIGLQQTLSLGAAMLVAGWLYFPLRQWLWRRLIPQIDQRLETLLPLVSRFAFIADPFERERHWEDALTQLYAPLEITGGASATERARILDDGLALALPAIGELRARTLRYAAGGKRLFSSRDARIADTLCALVRHILSGRTDYEQVARRERQRLARDLHDNLGARLLRLIHHLRGSPEAEIARDAMRDLRDAIAAIDAAPAPLEEALADWRAECDSRCSAAGAELHWEQPTLPPLALQAHQRTALAALMREAVTNALKHAAPRCVRVRAEAEAGAFSLSVENDGAVGEPREWREGYGLRNMRARAHDLGARLDIVRGAHTVRVTVTVPLEGFKR